MPLIRTTYACGYSIRDIKRSRAICEAFNKPSCITAAVLRTVLCFAQQVFPLQLPSTTQWTDNPPVPSFGCPVSSIVLCCRCSDRPAHQTTFWLQRLQERCKGISGEHLSDVLTSFKFNTHVHRSERLMASEVILLNLQGPIHKARLALQQISKAELCLLALLLVVCCG